MGEVVIKAENLGKKYIIGHLGKGVYKTFREQIGHHVHNIYSRTKQLVTGQQVLEGDEKEEFWALQNINFEIKKGERIGIIGRNGAGKSTLLKILSRITEPTTGRVSIKGRVASLLEVGTGFHHELTGRENIFLNGAILGMSRREIKKRFDEIVEFSSVEKFLDTPVKRYSSGMYVRLAFAIAAHLESEILIVDEVLAVGDAEFQKKCFVKMDEVSKSGRTILFVSHQLNSVMSLCQRSMVLEKGQILQFGETAEVIDFYLASINDPSESSTEFKLKGLPTLGKEMYFESVIAVDINQKAKPAFFHNENICLLLKIKFNVFINGSQVWVSLLNKYKKRVFTSFKHIDEQYVNSDNELIVMISIPANTIAPNRYSFLCSLEIPGCPSVDVLEDICSINVMDAGSELASQYGFDYGDVLMDCTWIMKKY